MRMMATCAGCDQRIVDQYLLRVDPDMEWHASCLRCNGCGQLLDEFCTCFVRDGKTYCKKDYIRLFSSRCSRCEQNFQKNDLVMKTEQKLIFHLNCFTCDTCGRQLMSGDKYAIQKDDQRIFCEVDYEIMAASAADNRVIGEEMQQQTNDGEDVDTSTSHSTQSSDNVVVNISHFDDTSLKKNSSETAGGLSASHGCAGGGSKSSRSSGTIALAASRQSKSADQKTTRVRTVLNEKQLHMLRTCYGANPRPDALMKEQLVEMTGLSSRVIRVWFQNKRCKDKKRVMLMKQIHQHHQDAAAVSMVAASPVRHEPPVTMMPVAVQQYQMPWSTLMADTTTGSSYGSLQSSARLHKVPAVSAVSAAAAVVVLKETSTCCPSSREAGAVRPAPAAAAAAAFQKLLRTFGDLPEDEDDSLISIEEPCRCTTSQSSYICGPSVALKNSVQPFHPYILSTLNQLR